MESYRKKSLGSTRKRGAALLKSKRWSDCSFLVGSEPNQSLFHTHKLILAMSSPVFEAMFYGGVAEKSRPIRIIDIQPDTFKALINYIYADKLNIESFDQACDLYYAAKKYLLCYLLEKCTEKLRFYLTTKNAGKAYEFANLFDETDLMDKCMQNITLDTGTAIFDPSFADLKPSTVIKIFSQHQLNIGSELDLFKAAVQYFKTKKRPLNETSPARTHENSKCLASCSRDDAFDEGSNDCKNLAMKSLVVPLSWGEGETTKKTIKSVLQQIRFLTMTAEQFTDGPAQSSLLTESESYAILTNIVSSASKIPMPEGFSTSRIQRKRLTIRCNRRR